jgi:hypothetical protein
MRLEARTSYDHTSTALFLKRFRRLSSEHPWPVPKFNLLEGSIIIAPRTVYTLGGRYKSIEDLEDAPFGELILVRETGLILNAVYPIPILHLRDLYS